MNIPTGDPLQMTLKEIGHRLTELRKQKNYTSHETFANDYQLPRIQYWRLEKGKANFTMKTLITVLRIHDLTVEQFFLWDYKTTEKD
jgi:transcriptional regulator with XRE-family HTH domain